MTDKRFEIFPQNVAKDGTLIIIQKGLKLYNISDVVDLLNELHEENQGLKNDCGILVQSNQDYRKENEQLNQLLDYADDLIQSHLSEHFIRQWRNFKTGHKEYNDFWEEKLKKHNELKGDAE